MHMCAFYMDICKLSIGTCCLAAEGQEEWSHHLFAAANTDICCWKLEWKRICSLLVSYHWCEEDNLVKCFTAFLIKPTIYKKKSNPLLQLQIKDTTLKEEKKIYFQTVFLFINTINSWLFAHTSWQKLDNATLQTSSYLFVTPFDGFISCHP